MKLPWFAKRPAPVSVPKSTLEPELKELSEARRARTLHLLRGYMEDAVEVVVHFPGLAPSLQNHHTDKIRSYVDLAYGLLTDRNNRDYLVTLERAVNNTDPDAGRSFFWYFVTSRVFGASGYVPDVLWQAIVHNQLLNVDEWGCVIEP